MSDPPTYVKRVLYLYKGHQTNKIKSVTKWRYCYEFGHKFFMTKNSDTFINISKNHFCPLS